MILTKYSWMSNQELLSRLNMAAAQFPVIKELCNRISLEDDAQSEIESLENLQRQMQSVIESYVLTWV